MQNKFTNEDFERFLKQSAHGCRMRPSEDVWKGISRNLHQRKRRVGFATAALLLLASLLGYFSIEPSKVIISQPDTAASEGISGGSNNYLPLPADATRQVSRQPVASKTILRAQRPGSATTQSAIALADRALAPVVQMYRKEEVPVVPLERIPVPELTVAASVPPVSLNGGPPVGADLATTEPTATADLAATEPAAEEAATESLLSVESVNNVYRHSGRNSRVTFQLFFTPTVSYRKLSENKPPIFGLLAPNSPTPNYPALYSINSAVTHKPAIGLELGMAAKYPVAKNLKLKGGLQFNISRYDIRAFSYGPEVATIALRNSSNRVDYLGDVTNYRNFNGNRPNWLENFYFQLSAPVGLEVQLTGNERMHFGIGSSLQPTYVLGERAYLLSSDYKNYATVPWLTRKWNVNANVETFVGYSTGKMNWQVGPQVRYQLLSSFVSQYPVKENLFDFGLKVGVSMNKPNHK